MNKQELKTIIKTLKALGENPKELESWINIYDRLPKDFQEFLCNNLKEELKQLSAITHT